MKKEWLEKKIKNDVINKKVSRKKFSTLRKASINALDTMLK